MDDIISKARVLVEALPYMRAFYDKTIVIKYGGAAMVDAELKAGFATDVTLLRYIGLRPVIVHGGGPQIGEMLGRLGKQSEFVDGMRITDDETMEVVEMVLGGLVNAEIVSLIGRAGGKAIGLTGKDCGMLQVSKRLGADGRDLGRVGNPDRIDAEVLVATARSGFIPVIAPLASDEAGNAYNVNADAAAGKIAEALNAAKLILLTDVEGVQDAGGKLIARMDERQAKEAIANGSVKGGMIPKVQCCIEALANGVASATIMDGRVSHALLLEIFTDVGVGTQIRPS